MARPGKTKSLTKVQEYYIRGNMTSLSDEQIAADVGVDVATVARFRSEHPATPPSAFMDERGAVAMTAAASEAVDGRRGRRTPVDRSDYIFAINPKKT